MAARVVPLGTPSFWGLKLSGTVDFLPAACLYPIISATSTSSSSALFSPAVFVSKKEVRAWPLYGWLARLAGTVFVDRNRFADAYQANLSMARALSEGSVVVLFPEGTSSDGTAVLPFRAALLEAAITSREPISSAHISYAVENGSVEKEICYWGTMSFFPHLLRLMSLRGIRAQVRFATGAQRFEDRKVAASATRKLVLTLGNVLSSEQMVA